MTLHHSKHHNTYVTNLNVALEKLDTAMSSGDVSTIISLEGALKFNGGGHVNHTLFWENICAVGESSEPTGDGPLSSSIAQSFGDIEAMKKDLSAATIAVQGKLDVEYVVNDVRFFKLCLIIIFYYLSTTGSGWGWLGYNPKTARIECATCANQNPLQATTGLIPLLGIDVWEHAYYVDYRNVRPDYVNAIWSVINWSTVEKRLVDASKK